MSIAICRLMSLALRPPLAFKSVIVIMCLQPAWGACMDHQLGFQCLAGITSQGYLEKTDTSRCVMSALNLIRADNCLYGQALGVRTPGSQKSPGIPGYVALRYLGQHQGWPTWPDQTVMTFCNPMRGAVRSVTSPCLMLSNGCSTTGMPPRKAMTALASCSLTTNCIMAVAGSFVSMLPRAMPMTHAHVYCSAAPGFDMAMQVQQLYSLLCLEISRAGIAMLCTFHTVRLIPSD